MRRCHTGQFPCPSRSVRRGAPERAIAEHRTRARAPSRAARCAPRIIWRVSGAWRVTDHHERSTAIDLPPRVEHQRMTDHHGRLGRACRRVAVSHVRYGTTRRLLRPTRPSLPRSARTRGGAACASYRSSTRRATRRHGARLPAPRRPASASPSAACSQAAGVAQRAARRASRPWGAR